MGQAEIEYALLIAVLALTALVCMTVFSNFLHAWLAAVATQIVNGH